MDNLYSFVYRGILTDESLDKAGRRRRLLVGAEELERLAASLSLDALDQELSQDARRMAVVYQSIHTFENMVRRFVQKALSEAFEADWWSHVSEKIRNKVTSRMEEDAQFRWHGRRGGSEIMYCDFGDLSSMIATNWPVFVDVIVNLEWAKSLLNTLEKSRNLIMHGGMLELEDIERIGMNIRDWVRQVG